MEKYEPSLTSQLADSFNEGGWLMYPISLLGCLLPVLALVFVIVIVASKGQRALPLSLALLVLSVLPPSMGALGARFERAKAEEAVFMADPMDREVIRMGVEAETLNLTLLGLWSALLPSVIGCVLLGVGLSQRPRFAPRSV